MSGAASVTATSPNHDAPEAPQQPASVRLTVCRDGAVLLARVALATEDGLGTDCLVHFCGAQVQVRHTFAREAVTSLGMIVACIGGLLHTSTCSTACHRKAVRR